MAPPPLAVHETAELKLPVPVTVDVHVLVWPATIAVGLQLALTVRIVEVVELPLPLPLPHATENNRQPTAASIPKSRTLTPSLYLGNVDSLGNHGGDISTATETSHMPGLVEYES